MLAAFLFCDGFVVFAIANRLQLTTTLHEGILIIDKWVSEWKGKTMASNDRNYQLQGSYTRYYDGYHAGFDSEYDGPSKRRNFKTIESAIKAARKEFKGNEQPKVMRYEVKRDGRGRMIESHEYDESGRELSWSKDKPSFWHVDAMRIVDRETQKVLWQS